MRSLGAGAALVASFLALWLLAAPALPPDSREGAWLVLATGKLLLLPALLAAFALLPGRAAAAATVTALLLVEFAVGPPLAGLGFDPAFFSTAAILAAAWGPPLVALRLAAGAVGGARAGTLVTMGVGSLAFFSPFGLDAWLAEHQGAWETRALVTWVAEASPATLNARALGFDLFKHEVLYRRFMVGEQLAEAPEPRRALLRALALTFVLLAVVAIAALRRRRRAATSS